MRKIVLFGAGEISRHYTQILNQFEIDIWGYIDNNADRWGTLFSGKKIYAPDILKELNDFAIIIACSDVKGITEQLTRSGLKDKIILIDHVIKKGIKRIKIEEKYFNNSSNKSDKRKTVVIDNLDGLWGGAEDWAHKVAISMHAREHEVFIVENVSQKTEKALEKATLKIHKKEEDTYQVCKDLIEWMLQIRPFVLFNIWSSEVLWSASYVKALYPEDIRIISTVLNDNEELYQRQFEWNDYIDLYLCISSRVKNNFIKLCGVREGKLCFREPFIESSLINDKEYHVEREEPLEIGYPCRLTRSQKRADLLPRLISNLEQRQVNYKLNIAGDGPCKEEIMQYVHNNNLRDRVIYHGFLSRDELLCFLGRQDIYLNFSEYEGTSLTMLEAMARGCVPVVTDVSGVDDFIIDKENGLIADVGNLALIADNILYLDHNRELLRLFGRQSIENIKNKCNFEAYMNDIDSLIDEI